MLPGAEVASPGAALLIRGTAASLLCLGHCLAHAHLAFCQDAEYHGSAELAHQLVPGFYKSE